MYHPFTNSQYRFTIDATMYNVSKTARKSTSPPTPRLKPIWFTPDREGLSVNAYIETCLGEEMYLRGGRCGKECYQCKLHSRFPHCKARLREHRLPDCTQVCEQTGHHIHDGETEAHSGLSQRNKDEINRLLLTNNKLKPHFIITCIKKKHKDTTMTETTHRQIQQFINRQWVKHLTQYEENTVQRVQKFINNNKHYNEIDGDQCCVVDGDVSAERTHALFTSQNMMMNLVGTDELAFCSDDTHKLDLNEHHMTVMGAVDRK